jgi:serine/threonine-protein kinase
LKPKNILYDEQTDRLLLTDFGISRRAGGTATIAGAPGSPPYMAPEQWDPGGEFGNISGRTDIYSLGVILFQLLTGSLLFHGSADELRVHHCRTLPRKPSEIRPDRVDSSLDELCLKALAKKPSERYVSAREFANAIAAYRPPLPTGAGGTTGGDSTDAEGDGAADTPR